MPLRITNDIPLAQINLPIKDCINNYVCDETVTRKEDCVASIMIQLHSVLQQNNDGYLRVIYQHSPDHPNFFCLAFEIDPLPQVESQLWQKKDDQSTNIESAILAISQLLEIQAEDKERILTSMKDYFLTHRGCQEIKIHTTRTELFTLIERLLNRRLPQLIQDEKVMRWYNNIKKYGESHRNCVSFTQYASLYKLHVQDNNKEKKYVVIKSLNSPREIQTYHGVSKRNNIRCLKLKRSPEIILAFFKPEQETVCVVPTHFIVEETTRNDNLVQWCVPHAKFKGWVTEQIQLQGTKELKICGHIFPVLDGGDLLSNMSDHLTGDKKIMKEDLHNITRGLINALIQLSDHGFIHGDISVENIFYHPQNETDKQIQLIDLSGAIKMSTNQHCSQNQLCSSSTSIVKTEYRHPNIVPGQGCYHKNCVGFEQDVYSSAVVLLYIYALLEKLDGVYNIYKLLQRLEMYNTKSDYELRIRFLKTYFDKIPISNNDLSQIRSIIISLKDYALDRKTPIRMKEKEAHQEKLRAILLSLT